MQLEPLSSPSSFFFWFHNPTSAVSCIFMIHWTCLFYSWNSLPPNLVNYPWFHFCLSMSYWFVLQTSLSWTFFEWDLLKDPSLSSPPYQTTLDDINSVLWGVTQCGYSGLLRWSSFNNSFASMLLSAPSLSLVSGNASCHFAFLTFCSLLLNPQCKIMFILYGSTSLTWSNFRHYLAIFHSAALQQSC